MNKSIGFIGLGQMGGRMVVRLASLGYELFVYDTNESACERAAAAGAHVLPNIRAVADKAAQICLSLPTPAIVRAVLLHEGGVAGGSAVRQVIDFSTIGPQAATEFADALDKHKIEYIDAPVSGGVSGAEKGTLAVMVACSASARNDCEALLANIGKLFFVGEKAGQGQTVKLANNLLSMAVLAVSSEVMVMGAKVGIDPKIMLDAINAGSGRNSATQDKFPRAILPGTFDFGFAMGLAYKDVKLCIDEGENLGVPMFIGAAVREMYAAAHATQGANSDFTAVCRMIEGWAGTEVRSRQ